MFKSVDKLYQLAALYKEISDPKHKEQYPNLHELCKVNFYKCCDELEEKLRQLKEEVK